MRIPLAALAAFAAFSLSAATVTSVKVRPVDGLGGDTSDVLSRCQVRPGATYDPVICDRDVRALRDSGGYDMIRVEAEHDADGISVTYVIRRKFRFHAPLAVKGNVFWGAGKIAELAELKDGLSYGEADFSAAANRVRAAYLKKFFPDVKVEYSWERIENSGGAVNITFLITEGDRVKIHDFKFKGNTSIPAAKLRASFAQYPWWNPYGWFSDTPATAIDLEAARANVVNAYRDAGYLDVQVAGPARVKRPDGKTDMLFTVAEGPLYTVGSLSVIGVKAYPAAAVLAADTALQTNDVAGAAAMEKAAHQIEVFCGSGTNSLTDTRVDVRRIPSAKDPTVLDVTFAVTEGVPVEIRKVEVKGNDRTKDKVVRREISLSPGDPMLEDKAEQSKHRLESLNYFERVRYYLEKVEGGEAKDGRYELRDLVYEVSEKNIGNFMVGVGASSIDSVYGTVSLSDSNFDVFHPIRRGGGQKGRIYVEAGPRIQTYEASVTEPHLFDRLLELTVEGYRRMRWFDQYDVTRSGAAVTLDYPVKLWPTQRHGFGRLGFRYSLEYVEMTDVDDGYWSHTRGETDTDNMRRLFKDEESKYDGAVESIVRMFWNDDTRNSFLIPSRGHYTTLYGDIAAGGDNEIWRLGFNYRQYFTAIKKWEHVFSVGFRGETVDAFSDDVPIYDREFLGGPRSIRGVDYREIAPKVYNRGEHAPWGGQTMLMGTAEYTIPIVKYVRVAAFTDLGSVGEDSFDPNTSDLCWSVGLGLRLDIPNFPIRLDFAAPVKRPDDVDRQFFSFVIGYDF